MFSNLKLITGHQVILRAEFVKPVLVKLVLYKVDFCVSPLYVYLFFNILKY